ncbi:uncharacterized membrane protein YgdD (TMEM256/DUF423 family) [Luteibacter sp. Sphag1AF]|uniref:DUF423 domain-containing protein n=1 Tax=Luteibacter sp. Sphag1AF TaxID=2587031 RepID=UPI001611A6AE|nr:DUF423 domain-containing protein [Luteibacter sp. Sphag1AF]MBB3225499.1 uncharacterized membrane protein YgdD (TMEM256/DUF423 family) [Luteibacter sp. Sphag1AF]
MRQPVSGGLAALIALLGGSAVIAGAFGAHALRGSLDDAHLAIWKTGVDYHFWHSLALLGAVVGASATRARHVAVVLFTAGIVLFSGSLYALALGAPRFLGIITPVGGVAFVAGWIALALALRRRD